MFRALRKAVRTILPRREHPLLDAPLSMGIDDVARNSHYERVIANAGEAGDPFVFNRFREGLRWRHVLESFLPAGRQRILDLGAGNGAIELALAGKNEFWLVSVEDSWNLEAAEVHERAGVPFRRVRADAAALPFRKAAFEAVVFLETVEHVGDPTHTGDEIERVMADEAILLITTPPRYRYALRPDPHFGIRGLVLLPPVLQRAVARRRGFDQRHHYVDRIYSSVAQIARLFPACDLAAVLSRSRAPQRWFWDAILLRRRSRAT